MSEKIRVLIADKVSKTRDSMKAVLSLVPRIEVVGECNNGKSVIKMVEELRPSIVLLDNDMTGIDDISPTEILTATIPNILVIVTIEQSKKNNLKRAMAEGAREYIIKPIKTDAFIETIVNLYDKDKKRRMVLENIGKQNKVETRPKIITIFSTKGGVGKSIIATNTAVSIAKKTNEKVALIDLDLQFGDVSVMLNLYPKRTISDLMNEIQNLDSELLEEYLIEHPSAIKVLPSPLSPEYSEYITSLNIKKILKVLLESYKYIIIDTAPSFQDINLTALDMSDKILFITTLDLPSIKNVKVGLNVMKTLNYNDDKVNLILNQHHRQFGISPMDIEKATEKKIKHIIPEDNITVIQSVNSGKPFVLEQNFSSVTKSIMAIADNIIGKEEEKKALLKRMLRR